MFGLGLGGEAAQTQSKAEVDCCAAPNQLEHVQLADLAEVVPVDGEGDRDREQLRAAQGRPGQQPPVLGALAAEDAEPVDRAEDRQEVLGVARDVGPRGRYSWRKVLTRW